VGCSENSSKKWYIASVNIDKSNFKIEYSGDFCYKKYSNQYYARKLDRSSANRYWLCNGFYRDGTIVLTDMVKYVEFDVYSRTAKEGACVDIDYKFPKAILNAEIKEDQTILFHKENEAKLFDAQTGSQTSKAFSELLKLPSKETGNKEPYISKCFDQVQISDDQNEAFIISRVINSLGETHAVVFQYDFGIL